jgi:hypothetical protein
MGVLLHVQTAFWFVAGLLGRNMTMARARTVSDVRTLDELVTLSGRLPATCTTFICSEVVPSPSPGCTDG